MMKWCLLRMRCAFVCKRDVWLCGEENTCGIVARQALYILHIESE
jgi:hypothetical protein